MHNKKGALCLISEVKTELEGRKLILYCKN